MKFWNDKSWKAFGNAAKARSDGFYVQMQKHDRGGRAEGDQNGARYLLCVFQAENHHRNREDGNRGRGHGEGIPGQRKRFHAMKKIARDVVHLEAEEVTNL